MSPSPSPVTRPSLTVSSTKRRRRTVLAVLAALLTAVALPATAPAAQTRVETSSFTGADTDAGAFQGLGRVAVSQATGSVNAIDASFGTPVVDKLTAAGVAQDYTALSSSSLDGSAVTPPDGPLLNLDLSYEADVAVDNSGTATDGRLVVLSENRQTAYIFEADGTYVGLITGFGDPCGVAVDKTGDIWVADYASQTVKQYTAAGAATGTVVDTSAQGHPCHIALDSADNLYVNLYNGGVEKYDSLGVHQAQVDAATTVAVAVDRSTDQIYIAHPGRVSVYDAAGTPLYNFADSIIGGSLTGVAVNEVTDQVYVSDSGNNAVHIFGAPVLLPNVTATPATTSGTTVTLNGVVDPQGVAVSSCEFEYGTDTSYGQSAACAETVGSGNAPVSVHADISGLDPLQTYHFRLAVQSANGPAASTDANFFTATPPQVLSQSATDVTHAEATLKAQLNPGGVATTYHFEYGPTAGYGSEIPVTDASAGAGTAPKAISQAITGLEPAATYHFRVVAVNGQGTTNGPDKTFATYGGSAPPQSCPNAAFRTGVAANLPDCRAYEQATPLDKNGNGVNGAKDITFASEAGDAITYWVPGGIPGGVGSQDYPYYLARRGSGAWSSAGLLPPAASGEKANVMGWTRDLKTTFSRAADFDTNTFMYLARDSASGSFSTIVAPTPVSTAVGYAHIAASQDGSKVYFQANGALTPNAAAGVVNVYVWDRATGTVSLVGVLPDGTTPPSGSVPGGLGAEAAVAHAQDSHVVSDDGSSVVFNALGSGQLYVRKNAAGPGATTVHVSASQKTDGGGPGGTDPNGPQPAVFREATRDGSVVLFTSHEELTNNANTGPAAEGGDLYAYDVATGQLIDLTPDTGDANGADIQGVVGMSDDASFIYFAANGVLASGGAPGDCRLDQGANFNGECDLYVWHDGEIRFLARLALGSQSNNGDGTNWDSGLGNAAPERSGRVSPDGRTLLFISGRQLTAYDNHSVTCRATGCLELYRYRFGDPGVTCVSCNPSGAAPTGDARTRSITNAQGSVTPVPTKTRNLSADGNRVFFETPDSLRPEDTNGVLDVYAWAAEGSGSCHSSADDGGCLSLLSTGRSSSPSYFADASVTGDDAFFYTAERLVGQDEDGALDIYDARVNGGLASQHPVAPPACSGDSCRGVGTPSAPVVVPGTVTFIGSGNASGGARSKVTVSRKAVKGSSFRVTTNVSTAGVLTASGALIRSVRRPVANGGSLRLRIVLTAKAKATLKKKKKLTVRFKVTFKPNSGSTSTASVSLTVKA